MKCFLFTGNIFYLNGAENHQPNEYMKELNSDDMETPHFLVTYTVTENEKEQRIREHSCVVIASAPVTSPIMMIPSAADIHQRLQKYIKGEVHRFSTKENQSCPLQEIHHCACTVPQRIFV